VRYNVFNKSIELIMATSRIEQTETRIILDLNKNEAQYLREVLRNCPFDTTPDTEHKADQENRSAIWCELHNCLEAK
jgi:hypothetical protein